jgi:hypothetical protein
LRNTENIYSPKSPKLTLETEKIFQIALFLIAGKCRRYFQKPKLTTTTTENHQYEIRNKENIRGKRGNDDRKNANAIIISFRVVFFGGIVSLQSSVEIMLILGRNI